MGTSFSCFCLKNKEENEENKKEKEKKHKDIVIETSISSPNHETSELFQDIKEKKKTLKVISQDYIDYPEKNDEIVEKFDEDPLEKKYKIVRQLGKGGFGQALLVKNNILQKEFAMKIIRRNTIKNRDETIENEINILKNLDHPNILKIYEFYVTPKSTYILTEFCPENNLSEEIEKNGPLSESNCAFVIYQMLMAMRYYHKKKIIHRDIKPSNIMITKRESNGCFQIKLIDFGIAKIYHGLPEKVGAGTPDYKAPEIFDKKYDYRCDLWSLGVTMYKLLTNHLPFKHIDTKTSRIEKLLYYNINKSYKEYKQLSKEAKDLLEKLLIVNPEKRIKVKDALEHSWFKTQEFIEKNKINQIEPDVAKQIFKNILSYQKDNALKCTVMAYLIHNNTNLEPCLQAGKLFTNIDYNYDGKIGNEELKNGLREFLGLKSEEEAENKTKEIFNILGGVHDNCIDYEEFISAAVDPKIFLSENYLKSAFIFLDKDKSGDITIEDLKKRYCFLFNKNYEKMETESKSILENINKYVNEPLTYEMFLSKMKAILEE